MKPSMDEFDRTAISGLPMHVSALPGLRFHFNFYISDVVSIYLEKVDSK